MIACEGTAEVERLRALTAYRGVCLLGSPFDDAPQPVAVTDVGIEPAGTSEDPFVRATLALIPVGLA